MKRKQSIVFILLLIPGIVCAQDPGNTNIGLISVEPQNVFDLNDPTQNNVLFRLANRLHITTRSSFIRKQLLFREGEKFNPNLLQESERLLREYIFLRNARIINGMDPSGEQTVAVKTQDAWSTIPDVRYRVEGGEITWAAGIKERNLFGLGKTLGFYYRDELERTYKEFYYEDPSFFHSRWTFSTNYQRDGDRKSHKHYIARPFYSSIATWCALGEGEHTRLPIYLYEHGEDYAELLRNRKEIIAGAGLSLGSTEKQILRLRGNVFKKEDIITVESQERLLPVFEQRRMHGAGISLECVDQAYEKMQYVNTFDRYEDFNMGNEFFIRYGYSSEQWDSDRNRHLFKVTEQKGFRTGHHAAVFFSVNSEGRVEKKKAANIINFYHMYHYARLTPAQTLVTSANYEEGKNLDPEEQLLLGGDTGLRGYPVSEFSGSRKFLFNIEYRAFLVHNLLNLLSIGGILFFDSGYVWPEGKTLAMNDMRSNIGFGVRLDPTRGNGMSPFNISVAYALNGNDRNSRWMLTISGRPDLLNSIGIPDDKTPRPAIKY